jgi:hypothetical protein
LIRQTKEALAIATEFGWKSEKVAGSMIRLKQTLYQTIDATMQGKINHIPQ